MLGIEREPGEVGCFGKFEHQIRSLLVSLLIRIRQLSNSISLCNGFSLFGILQVIKRKSHSKEYAHF